MSMLRALQEPSLALNTPLVTVSLPHAPLAWSNVSVQRSEPLVAASYILNSNAYVPSATLVPATLFVSFPWKFMYLGIAACAVWVSGIQLTQMAINAKAAYKAVCFLKLNFVFREK